MKRLLNILSKPQVLILLSLGVLFFSFGIVGNIVGGEGCGGGGDSETNGEYAEDDGGDSTGSARISGKFFAGATGKFTESMLASLHPDEREIAKGNQFIERTAYSDSDYKRKYFTLVHHSPLIRNKHLLATPLNEEGEALSEKYGLRFVVPKGDGVNKALPKFVIFVPPLKDNDLKRPNGELKPIVYVGSKDNYPNCDDTRYYDLKLNLPDAQLLAEVTKIRDTIANKSTPSCTLELAIRSYCDGKGGAIIKVLKGIHLEEPWQNTFAVVGAPAHDDYKLYSGMYLQKACSGMVITNDNNENAEIRMKGVDITKNTPDGTATDKGEKDGNWYLADPTLNVWISKWGSSVQPNYLPLLLDGKPQDNSDPDPKKRNYAAYGTNLLDARIQPADLAGYEGQKTVNFMDSEGPLYSYLRRTASDVQSYQGIDYIPCKTKWGCQKGGSLYDHFKEADPRLTDVKKTCDHSDFFPYEHEKNPDGTMKFGFEGNMCSPFYKRDSKGELILRPGKQEYFDLIDKIAFDFISAFNAKKDILINHRHINRLFKDTLIRKKFCEPVYKSEEMCKKGGFIILKLPPKDSPGKHKIEVSYQAYKVYDPDTIITAGKLFIRGVRLNRLHIRAGGPTQTSNYYKPDDYALKLDGVEIVSAAVDPDAETIIIVDNSYFNKSRIHPVCSSPTSRIHNTFLGQALGKTVAGNGSCQAKTKTFSNEPWKEKFKDKAEGGYFTYQLNTGYQIDGINLVPNNWLIDDNAFVNGGAQECIFDGGVGVNNTRAHQNLCFNSGAGTAIPIEYANDVDIINNQFIHFSYGGDGTWNNNKRKILGDFMSNSGGTIGVGNGSKNVLIENNLIAKSSYASSTAISVVHNKNIKVRHNTIASENVAPITKEFSDVSGIWQWDDVKKKYFLFDPKATYKDDKGKLVEWLVQANTKYRISQGIQLPGGSRGIALSNQGWRVGDDSDKITLERNIAIGSITEDFTKLYYPAYRGDYDESITDESEFVERKENYFEICGVVNHSPANTAYNLGKWFSTEYFLNFKQLEKGTVLRTDPYNPDTDRCNMFKNDLQYFYSLKKRPRFRNPEKNDFHINNPAKINCSGDNKYSHIGFNYWDERCGETTLPSNTPEEFKIIEIEPFFKLTEKGYPNGNLDGNYPKYSTTPQTDKSNDNDNFRNKSRSIQEGDFIRGVDEVPKRNNFNEVPDYLKSPVRTINQSPKRNKVIDSNGSGMGDLKKNEFEQFNNSRIKQKTNINKRQKR